MHRIAARRRISSRRLQTVVLLTSTLLAPGLVAPAVAQTAVKARSTSLAPQGIFIATSDATIVNGVLTAQPAAGGSATGGPTGAGVTSASTKTHQHGSTASGTMRTDAQSSVDLPTGILRSLITHTPVTIHTMGIANASFEEGVYFVNTTGAPIAVPIRWRVPGVVVPNGPGIGYQGVFASIRFNESGFAFGIPMPAIRGTAGHTEVLTYENVNGARRFYNPNSGKFYFFGTSPAWDISALGPDGALMETGMIVPPGLSKMQVVATLNVDCRGGVSCDYHTQGSAFEFDPLPAGLSMASDSGTFFGAPRPSAAPSGLTATSIVGNRVTLKWTPPTTALAVNYIIEGGVGPGQVLGGVTLGSIATIFSFDAPTGSFYLRVHALTTAGRSAASNEILVHVNVPQPPGTPTGLLGLADGSRLYLSWRNASVGGAATSLVLDVGGAIVASLPIGVSESFRFNSVPPGTYAFAVRAANAVGVSAPSSPVTLTFPGACSGAPLPPTGLTVTSAGNTLSLVWELPATGPAVTGYVLGVTGAIAASLPLGTRSIAGAVPSGTYHFTVQAANPCGLSAPTPAQTITVP